MTERLDTQKPPSRLHARKSIRWHPRGYQVVPHPVWGDPDLVGLLTVTTVNLEQGDVHADPS